MKAVLIMGSESDKPHAEKITSALSDLGVPFEEHVASAHKNPERVLEIIRSYPKGERGCILYCNLLRSNFIRLSTCKSGTCVFSFGFGQFIPSSFNSLSIDYNNDGKKDPFNWEDVIGSVAFYLVENGYPKNDYNFTYKSKAWRAIRTYNRSDKYANIIIDLRNEIAKNIFLSD